MSKMILKRTMFAFCICAVMALALYGVADIPHMINYQGAVTVSGSPFTGTGYFKCAIVNAAGNITYWSNDGSSVNGSEPTSAVSLAVTDGRFSIALGDTSLTNMTLEIPTDVFSSPETYLRIWFNDGVHGSQLLTPDTRLVSSPYSYLAESVQVPLDLDASVASPSAIISGSNSGTGYGVHGSNSYNNYGYLGYSYYGVYGRSGSALGAGVQGYTIGSGPGVKGLASGGNYGTLGSPGYGVYGLAASGYGVYGIHESSNNYGALGSPNYGVYGSSSSGYAGYFDGNVRLNKDNGELVLRTTSHNESGRYKIKFDNNSLAPFTGDDTEDQTFSFLTTFANNRTYDAHLRVFGRATSSWGNYIEMTHDGTDGKISTDVGDIVLSPAGYVGIGTSVPKDKLEVVGSSGAFAAVDGGTGLSGFSIRESGVPRWILFFRQWQSDNLIVRDEVGSLDTMTFEAGTGRVGIGTGTPGATLDVNGLARIQGSTWPTTGKGMELGYSGALNKGYIQVFDRDGASWGNLYLGDGNVGIGVGSPAAKLEAYNSSANNTGKLATSLDGVYGSSSKSNGSGVAGVNSGGGNGVYGYSNGGTAMYADSNGGYGMQARTTGGDYALVAFAQGGIGLYAEGDYGGNAAVFKGNVVLISRADSSVILELGEGLDYAEGFDVSEAAEEIGPGSVLIIDADNPGQLALSNKPYDNKVAGIVAGANGQGSGVRLGTGKFDHDVALAGRVYCNVDATEAGVEPGDLLTTSARPGYAMKARDYARAQGAILGKAMERLEKGSKGQIMVLVTLQ